MRILWWSFFFIVISFLLVLLAAASSDLRQQLSSNSTNPDPSPPSPVASKINTAIVATPDGTVYIVEKTGKVTGSFISGTPIYSSYQALPHYRHDNASSEDDHFYMDIGEDWQLYFHGYGVDNVKLPLSVEDFLKHTPYVSTGGGVTLGSKRTTVFVFDVKAGKVIHTSKSDIIPSDESVGVDENTSLEKKDVEEWVASGSTDLEAGDKLMYITRTDYALKHIYTRTGKVLWYLTFADFEASFQCNDISNVLGGLSRKGDKSGPGHRVDTKSPLHCQMNPVIYRIRDRSSLESLFMSEKLPDALPGEKMLPLPAPEPAARIAGKRLGYGNDGSHEVLLALPPLPKDNVVVAPTGGDTVGRNSSDTSAPDISAGKHVLSFVLFPFVLVIVACLSYIAIRKNRENDLKLQAVTSKKKKNRKSGMNKDSAIIARKKNDASDDKIDSVPGLEEIEKTIKDWQLNHMNNYDVTNGRKIGKLFISNKEIAKGSNGTVVFEGLYDGRPVAVKRLVQSHHDVAVKEIQNLIASDQHPNIVRWYGVEHDQDFIYLSLERCTCSLHELISSCACRSQREMTDNNNESSSFGDFHMQLNLINEKDKDYELWRPNGYPSPQLLKLMRDIVHGLGHLHELGIIHRDLKPQNVLVLKERSICAKLSDMGISKRLSGDMSSLTKHTGSGSSGWQAAEQLKCERQTRAVDLFSLGCVLFFCITGGKHPFGDILERDINVVNNRKDLFLIDHIPEATDLISRLLEPNPELRPKAVEVPCHPLFWNAETRLSFLRDASDRVELEDRENGSDLLKALESIGAVAFGGQWDVKMDSAVISDIGRYRRYKFDSIRDLLRVIRNKLNHYRELSKENQGILGQLPEGFDNYFSSRFPKLLIEVYKVIHTHCSVEETFQKYFRNNQI